MKKDKRRKKGLTVLVMALLFIGLMTPAALSYFNSLEKQGISIRATPASEIWELSGSFNESRWKQSNKTGIYITNKCRKDLWISFEYEGQLKQVFKHSDPVLLKAGTTQEIVLQPLDDKDSPRILNPCDLIDCQGCQPGKKISGQKCGCILNCCWKTFSGQLKIHILNEYASLASGNIRVSGDTLWYVFFARKYCVDPETYYEKCWDEGILEPEMKCSQLRSRIALQGIELEQAAAGDQLKAQDFLQEWEEYQPIDLLLPVMQVVEKVAPGLLEERSYFITTLRNFQIKLENLSAIIDAFKAQEQKLREQIRSQQEIIMNLTNHLHEMEMINQNLRQQLNSFSTPHPIIGPVQLPGGVGSGTNNPGTMETNPGISDSPAIPSDIPATDSGNGSDSGGAVPGSVDSGAAPAEGTKEGLGGAASGSGSGQSLDSGTEGVSE